QERARGVLGRLPLRERLGERVEGAVVLPGGDVVLAEGEAGAGRERVARVAGAEGGEEAGGGGLVAAGEGGLAAVEERVREARVVRVVGAEGREGALGLAEEARAEERVGLGEGGLGGGRGGLGERGGGEKRSEKRGGEESHAREAEWAARPKIIEERTGTCASRLGPGETNHPWRHVQAGQALTRISPPPAPLSRRRPVRSRAARSLTLNASHVMANDTGKNAARTEERRV